MHIQANLNARTLRSILLFGLLIATSAFGTHYPRLYLVEVFDCNADLVDTFDCSGIPNFWPGSLTIVAGDSVMFANATGNVVLNMPSSAHNVVADDGSFRCAEGCDGEGGNGNPSASLWYFSRTFNTPGVVKYHDEASGAAGVITVSPPDAVAVEYYYPDWNFYFVTSSPDEIDALDGGAFGGAWTRTGETFNVWTDTTDGALPTCRFLSTGFAPKSTHFYTMDPAECASLQTSAAWQYEGIAFYLELPTADPDSGALCPAGAVPLYRFYNNGMGGAPNHRYTTAQWIASEMLAAGWVAEGIGSDPPVFACARQ